MRIGSVHDLLWENSFPVQAAVVEPVFTVSFVIQSMYLDFLAGYWYLTWVGRVAVVGEKWVLVENNAVYPCCMKCTVFGKF